MHLLVSPRHNEAIVAPKRFRVCQTPNAQTTKRHILIVGANTKRLYGRPNDLASPNVRVVVRTFGVRTYV